MLKDLLKQIGQDNAGASLVEYALIVSLIVLAMITALQSVATETLAVWNHVETQGLSAMGS